MNSPIDVALHGAALAAGASTSVLRNSTMESDGANLLAAKHPLIFLKRDCPFHVKGSRTTSHLAMQR